MESNDRLTPGAIDEMIALRERRELDVGAVAVPSFDVAQLHDDDFIRVRGIAAFWRANGFQNYAQRAVDLAVSAHAYSGPLLYVIAGTPQSVEVYMRLHGTDATSDLLRSMYPGVTLDPPAPLKWPESIPTECFESKRSRYFMHSGACTGIPARRGGASNPSASDGDDESAHLERVIRGMRGTYWMYVVSASHIPRQTVVQDREQLLTDLTRAASEVQWQEPINQLSSRTIVNRRAQYLVDLLEREVERADYALALGQWKVEVYFTAFTDRNEDNNMVRTTDRLGRLLVGTLSGPDSRPDRFRATPVDATTAGPRPITKLNSQELGLLIQLPREEVAGYAVTDFTRYDVDYRLRNASSPPVHLGPILCDGAESGVDFDIALNDLTKHGLIVGVTGSGKTTTLRRLLDKVRLEHKPFLVIEPAKTEYRVLVDLDRQDRTQDYLRIFTLGNEAVAPFRLNPFEFETVPLPHNPFDSQTESNPEAGETTLSLLLSHIDILKAVFNAAFILYAPMPYVLEVALYEVYEDKGWNLATGRNIRLGPRSFSRQTDYPIFPTLADLFRKVEAVTRRLGYEQRIEQDVIAGLKARIDSLRVGSKGMMLDVPRGIPMAELLSQPTILELENIGNDSEKTFVMGLILARLYEARRLQAACGSLETGLQHVLVIEEAHRLLQKTGTDVDVESSNLRAQAVETFVNMLSEIRRYGQSVLVAEQIPSKLAPDVVKNTNLKVIHRLLAEDDRTALAGAMNMSDEQSRHLVTLMPGQATVFGEGDDHPYLIKVPDILDGRPTPDVSDSAVGDWARDKAYIKLGRYLPTRVELYDVRATAFEGPDTAVYQRALRFVTSETEPTVWARLIARVAYAPPTSVAEQLQTLRRAFHNSVARLSTTEDKTAFRLALVLAAVQTMQERAAEHHWSFPEADRLRHKLTRAVLSVLDASGDLERPGELCREFADDYADCATRAGRSGPYAGCVDCSVKCQYRSEVVRILSAKNRVDIQMVLTGKVANPYGSATRFLEAGTTIWFNSRISKPTMDGISYCTALVALAELPEHIQLKVAKDVAVDMAK